MEAGLVADPAGQPGASTALEPQTTKGGGLQLRSCGLLSFVIRGSSAVLASGWLAGSATNPASIPVTSAGPSGRQVFLPGANNAGYPGV